MKKTAVLHPNNPTAARYPMAELCIAHKDLEVWLTTTPSGEPSIDFQEPKAVVALNTALLKHYFGINHWFVPEGALCPPVPGRADYIYHLADLLAEANNGQVPKGANVRILDIGTGTTAIYALLAHSIFGWKVTATDIDANAIKIAQLNVQANKGYEKAIKIVRQPRANRYFKSVLKPHMAVYATVCNPPFYSSAEEAQAVNQRKNANLNTQSARNFGGLDHELWCEGGELRFISQMVQESQQFAENVCWFTSLLSNKDHIEAIMNKVEQVGAAQFRTVDMAQGQKQSRFVAWSFLTETEQQDWLASQQQ